MQGRGVVELVWQPLFCGVLQSTDVPALVRCHFVDTEPRRLRLQSHPEQVKGLGKPPMFQGVSSKFTEWLKKTTGFLIAAYGSASRPVIESVQDQDNVITEHWVDTCWSDRCRTS